MATPIAYEREGQHFGVVRLVLLGGAQTLEFGVSAAGYSALKRILSARPFDALPGIQYRYFFSGSFTGATKPGQDVFTFHIRIEQGAAAKKFEFNGPKALLANLLWFSKLNSPEETLGLKRLDQEDQLGQD
jgi:hypothetical protein